MRRCIGMNCASGMACPQANYAFDRRPTRRCFAGPQPWATLYASRFGQNPGASVLIDKKFGHPLVCNDGVTEPGCSWDGGAGKNAGF